MTDDSIGIDISKDQLDAFRLSDGACRAFDNSQAGFRKLRRWLEQTSPVRVVYEPTGPYHGAFELACSPHLPLCKVNPLQARRFAQARGTRAKTDAVDARMLAAMGAAFALEPDRPVPDNQHELKELQVQRSALVKDRTRLLNRLKTQTLALTRRQTKSPPGPGRTPTRSCRSRNRSAAQANPGARTRYPALHSRHRLRRRNSDPDRMPRNRLARTQTDRQPCRPRPNDPPVGKMARACVHSGRPQIPARRALYARPGRHPIQPGHESEIHRHVQCRKAKESRAHRDHEKTARTRKRSDPR